MNEHKVSKAAVAEDHIEMAADQLDNANTSYETRAAILAQIAQAQALMLIYEKLSSIETAIKSLPFGV